MDDDIVINLSTAGHEIRPRKRKVVGNRGQRIRARRAEKLREESLDSDCEDDQKHNAEGGSDSNPSIASHGVAGQRTGAAIISSLFNCNPRIPAVPRATLTPAKEKVFSTKSFSELNLHPFLVSNLRGGMGVMQMTSVQSRSIPVLLDGHDALVKSQTGSGKTLAYAIPVVQSLQAVTPHIRREEGPYAIVVVPTRELAIQSHTTFQKLVRPFVWVVPGCIMGGEKRKAEKSRLRKGINVLVATPGRLLDHLEHTNCLDVSRVRWLILDEADRLLDMGYEKDVAKIVTALNQKQKTDRQTVMLSATLTAGVERLAGLTLRTPERISVTDNEDKVIEKSRIATKDVGDTGSLQFLHSPKENIGKPKQAELFTVPDKLKQHYVIVPCKLRLVTLMAFILSKCKYESPKSKMIVFLSTQDSVSFHHDLLDSVVNSHPPEITESGLFSDQEENVDREDNLKIFRLHGDMLQKERTKVYQDFSVTSSGVLFCTDVAARGLDLPKVRWIVQYTSPGGAAEYVHRVGRTARAGGQGQSLLFLMPAEVEYIQTLNSHQISLIEMKVAEILKTALLHVRDIQLNHTSQREAPRTYEEAATLLQIAMEEKLNADKPLYQLAQKAYQSFVKAYSTYPADLKAVFSMRNLHLGHVAKSFALRKTPKDIGLNFSKLMASSKDRKRKPNKITFTDDTGQPKKKMLRKDFSEYSSGSKGKKKPFSGPCVGKRKKWKRK